MASARRQIAVYRKKASLIAVVMASVSRKNNGVTQKWIVKMVKMKQSVMDVFMDSGNVAKLFNVVVSPATFSWNEKQSN